MILKSAAFQSFFALLMMETIEHPKRWCEGRCRHWFESLNARTDTRGYWRFEHEGLFLYQQDSPTDGWLEVYYWYRYEYTARRRNKQKSGRTFLLSFLVPYGFLRGKCKRFQNLPNECHCHGKEMFQLPKNHHGAWLPRWNSRHHGLPWILSSSTTRTEKMQR